MATKKRRKAPQLIEEYVKASYWACNVLHHRHTSEHSARACISKRLGELGELEKLARNLPMLAALRRGEKLTAIAAAFKCSDSNVTKTVNTSLAKAREIAASSGGCPYPARIFMTADFVDPKNRVELDYYTRILKELQVKLERLTLK